MALNFDNVKLVASEQMSDFAEGGGQITTNVIENGDSQQIFDDVSTLDRAQGRLSARKTFLKVSTDNQDRLLSSHVIVAKPPENANTEVVLFSQGDYFNKHKDAIDSLETYWSKGGQYGGHLLENQVKGAKLIQYVTNENGYIPTVGRIIYIGKFEESSSLYKFQFLKVVSVRLEQRQFIVKGNVVFRQVASIEIASPLNDNYKGLSVSDYYEGVKPESVLRETITTDATRVYSTKSLTQAVKSGDFSINVESIRSAVAPISVIEQLVQSKPSIKDNWIVSNIVKGISAYTNSVNSEINFGTPIVPNSIKLKTGTGVYTFNYYEKDGVLYVSNSPIMTIDYEKGIGRVIKNTNFPASPTKIDFETGSKINLPLIYDYIEVSDTPSYQYSTFIEFAQKDSIKVSYISEKSKLTGSVNDTNALNFSYDEETGLLNINLQYLPDSESIISIEFTRKLEGVQEVQNPKIFAYSYTFQDDLPKGARVNSVLESIDLLKERGEINVVDKTIYSINYINRWYSSASEESKAVSYSNGQAVLSSNELGNDGVLKLRWTWAQNFKLDRHRKFTQKFEFLDNELSFAINDNKIYQVWNENKIIIAKRDSYQTSNLLDYKLIKTAKIRIRVKITTIHFTGLTTQSVETVEFSLGDIIDLQDNVSFSKTYIKSGNEVDFKYSHNSGAWFINDDQNLVASSSINDYSIYDKKTRVLTVTNNYSNAANVKIYKYLNVENFSNFQKYVYIFEKTSLKSDSVTLSFSYNGQRYIVKADKNGKIFKNGICEGKVNFEKGFVIVEFGEWVTIDENVKAEYWYNPERNRQSDNTTWKPLSVEASSILVTATSLDFVPIDANIVGIDASRLPIDGKVPCFRQGDVIVIHNTKRTNVNSFTKGSVINIERTNVSDIVLIDSDGKKIPSDFYEINKKTGTLTLLKNLDLTSLKQPIYAEHRIEDMNVVNFAYSSGILELSRPVVNSYEKEGTLVSSALLIGDLYATVSTSFSQRTWDTSSNSQPWKDESNGTITSRYDTVDFPIKVINSAAESERWALIFTSSSTFKVIGENLGEIASGNTSEICKPLNKITGLPYFEIDPKGWGTGWSAGNVFRFNTRSATYPIWIARAIQPNSDDTQSDKFCIMIRGDTNRN